jgi:hypothetical protein
MFIVPRPSAIRTIPFQGLVSSDIRSPQSTGSYMEKQYSLVGKSVGDNKFKVDEEFIVNNNGKIQKKEKHRIIPSPYTRRKRPNQRVHFMNQPYPPMIMNMNTMHPSSSIHGMHEGMPSPFDDTIRFVKPRNRQSAKRKQRSVSRLPKSAKRANKKKGRRSKNNEV